LEVRLLLLRTTFEALTEGRKALLQAVVETVPMILTKLTREIPVGAPTTVVMFAAVRPHALLHLM
jgi:hypothetical protein